MTQFRRSPVLVPTDLSPASLPAVRVARSIVDTDQDVTVASIALDYDLVVPSHVWGMDVVPEDSGEAQMRRLQEWAVNNEIGDVALKVRRGDPGMAICALAKEIDCPLIVVPSHGRKGLKRVLLGSVAERIIRHCHCSVLVLRRETEAPSTQSNGSWFPRKRVLVPIDFSAATPMAIDTASELVDDIQHIDVINVAYTLDDAMTAGAIVVTADELQENRQECLTRYMNEHGWGSLRCQALVGDPGLTIAEHAEKIEADLIVMPSHGYHGLDRLILGSTTERVIRHATTPVLVLRRGDVS